MSDKEKMSKDDWKKLEDQAYYELIQIIAEAMQLQDIELLDARISAWKTKYKKLLDRPTTDSRSDFKKRIEFLLNQYYSSVTQYILNQLKLKEQKKVENQAKAMRELYNMIRDTNDLGLLKKKIDAWKQKYPVSGFLNMYQKRIAMYTRKKNIEANAFDQESAFSDLVDITKIHGTYDELKEELNLWEKKYSIGDKYTIDDFIKHQSEVQRFISDEFLISIARDDPKDIDEANIEEQYNNKDFSDISIQTKYYTRIASLSNSPNNNEMFKLIIEMVQKGIVFDPSFVGRIIPQISKQYSLKNLSKIDVSNLDVSKNSLSFEEYKDINNIKRYAILSYFNMLLPQGSQIPNPFFKESILKLINSKVSSAKSAKNMNDTSTSMDELIKSGIEIPLDNDAAVRNEIHDTIIENEPEDLENHEISTDEIYINNDDTSILDETEEKKEVVETRKNDEQINPVQSELNISKKVIVSENESYFEKSEENKDEQATIEVDAHHEEPDIVDTTVEHKSDFKEDYVGEVQQAVHDTAESKNNVENTVKVAEFTEKVPTKDDSIPFDIDVSDTSVTKTNLNSKKPIENLDYNDVIVFSPLFFATINNLDKQSVAVGIIDKTVNKHMQQEKSIEANIDTPIKTKNDAE